MNWWLVWISIVWLLWLLRNEVVFNEGKTDIDHIFHSITLTSWKWMQAYVKGFTTSFYEWGAQPLLCL